MGEMAAPKPNPIGIKMYSRRGDHQPFGGAVEGIASHLGREAAIGYAMGALARAISQAVLYSLVLVGVLSPAHALTQQELVAKLESAGYSQIRDIKSIAEGTAVKAMKNGKEVSLVVDSSGQIQERR